MKIRNSKYHSKIILEKLKKLFMNFYIKQWFLKYKEF